MTGATSFTRRAGFVGLLCTVLTVTLTPMSAYVRRREAAEAYGRYVWDGSLDVGPSTGDAMASVALASGILAGFLLLAGLVVRHRHHVLATLAKWVAAFGVGTGLVLNSPDAARPLVWTAVLLALIAVIVVGELPPVPAILLILAPPISAVLPLAGLVVGFAGGTWLAWAMWREPVARDVRTSLSRAEAVTA